MRQVGVGCGHYIVQTLTPFVFPHVYPDLSAGLVTPTSHNSFAVMSHHRFVTRKKRLARRPALKSMTRPCSRYVSPGALVPWPSEASPGLDPCVGKADLVPGLALRLCLHRALFPLRPIRDAARREPGLSLGRGHRGFALGPQHPLGVLLVRFGSLRYHRSRSALLQGAAVPPSLTHSPW